MQLNKHADHAFAVQAIAADGLKIANQLRQAPFAVSARGVQTEFAAKALPLLSDFALADVALVLSAKPEVVLFATGAKMQFPSAQIRGAFLSQGVGLEVMDNRAAAYTYNVMLQEQREVLLLVLA
jgi:uncharacterized protein